MIRERRRRGSEGVGTGGLDESTVPDFLQVFEAVGRVGSRNELGSGVIWVVVEAGWVEMGVESADVVGDLSCGSGLLLASGIRPVPPRRRLLVSCIDLIDLFLEELQVRSDVLIKGPRIVGSLVVAGSYT